MTATNAMCRLRVPHAHVNSRPGAESAPGYYDGRSPRESREGINVTILGMQATSEFSVDDYDAIRDVVQLCLMVRHRGMLPN